MAGNIRLPETRDIVPSPDAHRPPGYPFFLYPFVDFPATDAMLWHVVLAQAIVSALTVLLSYALFRQFLPTWASLAGAALTALSPHLVSGNAFLLTEPLFTFFLVATAAALLRAARSESPGWFLAAGALLGCAMLIRPTLDYLLVFLVPAYFLLLARKPAIRMALLTVVGCAIVYSPWVARNAISVSDELASTKAIDSIHLGMYPDVTYQGIPRSYGHADMFDPEYKNRDTAAIFDEIGRRFQEEPGRHIYWYLVGKPIFLFSWNVAVGMGDVFVYPVFTSPYHESRLFYGSHQLMYWLHWPLMTLALAVAAAAWFPVSRRFLSDPQRMAARLISVIIGYFLLVHMVGLPLPRYGFPTRPLMYGLALLGIAAAVDAIRLRLTRRRAVPAAA